MRRRIVWRLLVAAHLLTSVAGAFCPFCTQPEPRAESQTVQDAKAYKICSIAGGLHLARFVSTQTRRLFEEALADVELMREYISEAAFNGGIVGGMHTRAAMNASLDWEGRGLDPDATTFSAGIGYSDDRPDRRIERSSAIPNEPFVGTKETDLALADSVSNLFPWIVDRKAVHKDAWYLDHQNGQLVLEGNRMFSRHTVDAERLYVAAWLGTYGEAWWYYPPTPRILEKQLPPGAPIPPLTGTESIGVYYNSHEEPFIKPNVPPNNPEREAHFTKPYADTGMPGLSMITALAPVYFTGRFMGYDYQDTYIASTGVDMSVASLATLLQDLQDSLTAGSFAVLVNVADLAVICISQQIVEKIYPSRTGMEDARVVYSPNNASAVLEDRRNVTYLVSDTIHQPLRQLENADWSALAIQLQNLDPGKRSSSTMNIILTGHEKPTDFYVLYERWANVADWALVVFAPKERVDNAISVRVNTNTIDVQVPKESTSAPIESVVMNEGILDVTVRLGELAPWLRLVEPLLPPDEEEYSLPASQNLTFRFVADSHDISLSANSMIAYTIEDDDYPDCFYDQVIIVSASLKVLYETELHQLDVIRFLGFAFVAIILWAAATCSTWVRRHATHRVVRASQPLFLHVICIGIAVLGLSIIPMSLDDSVLSPQQCSMACMAVPWLLALGFSITFSALFSKIWRVNQVVKALTVTYRRVDVKPHHVMVPFVAICSANVVLLALWTIFDPLVWVRETAGDGQGMDEFKSYGSCRFSTPSSIVLAVLLLLVNFVALVLALFQLFQARAMSSEYSEGIHIAIAIGSNLQVVSTGVPIIVMLGNWSPRLLYFVKISLVFFSAMSVLLLMFVPKFYLMKYGKSSSVRFGSSHNSPPVDSDDDLLDARLGGRSNPSKCNDSREKEADRRDDRFSQSQDNGSSCAIRDDFARGSFDSVSILSRNLTSTEVTGPGLQESNTTSCTETHHASRRASKVVEKLATTQQSSSSPSHMSTPARSVSTDSSLPRTTRQSTSRASLYSPSLPDASRMTSIEEDAEPMAFEEVHVESEIV